MTTIARRVRSTPVRTMADTWSVIIDLITAADNEMRPDLEKAGNAAAMLIGEEHTMTDPIILSGCGPQVRIYTLHDTAAIDGANANEQSLTLSATDDWMVSLPATGIDYELASAALAEIDHIAVHDPSTVAADAAAAPARDLAPISIDLTVLKD